MEIVTERYTKTNLTGDNKQRYSYLMFIKKNTTRKKGKEYTNYLLVESHHTQRGPRHKVIVSLGNLKPAPPEYWHQLAKKVERALAGQLSLLEEPDVEPIVEKISALRSNIVEPARQAEEPAPSAQVDVDGIRIENHEKLVLCMSGIKCG